LKLRCIPFRVKKDSFDGEEQVEVLLVTRRSGQGWVIPKGGWESDDNDVEHAARRETVEEAGVRGLLELPVLGIFQFQSNKKSNCDSDVNCCVHVFAMRVLEQLEFWPEADLRKRDWFPIDQALKLCTCDWMRDSILVLIKRKNWTFVDTLPPNPQ